MITPLLISSMQQMLSNQFKKGLVTVNGITQEYEIYQTVVRDNIVKKYIYLEDEPQGVIERVALLDEFGRELMVQEPHIEKGPDGWMMSFKIVLEIKDESGDRE